MHGDKCEYCGTAYGNRGIHAEFNADAFITTMSIGNEELNVYISHMESEVIPPDVYRDAEGNLCRGKPVMKRTFTVVEL